MENVKKKINYILGKYDLNTIDSLEFVNMIIEIEDYFNIELPTELMDISIFNKIDDLVKLIKNKNKENQMDTKNKLYDQNSWHPWSKNNEVKVVIERGQDIYVYDIDEKKYLDARSCASNAICGYSNVDINNTIKNQINKLMNIDFQCFDSTVVQNLSQKILSMLPFNSGKVFYTSGGSEAVEMALKTVFDYRFNCKKLEKRYVLSLEEGYHGTTFLATMLSGLNHVKNSIIETDIFQKFSVHHFKDGFFEMVRNLGAENVSTLIFEPILGVGGYQFINTDEVNEVMEFCKKNDIIIILDETFTSFGRTGKMFNFEKYNFAPDILIIGKGITSGYFPYAATIVNEDIYESFEQDIYLGGLRYGHTNSGHTLGASIALSVISIIEKNNLINNSYEMGKYLISEIVNLKNPLMENIRGEGLLIALDIKSKGNFEDLDKLFLDNGLIVKRESNVLAIIPPLIINKNECDELIYKLEKTFHEFELQFSKNL